MLAAALLFAAPTGAVAGLYRAQQMEVGAALELKKDGHFRYQLDYGAVSERAKGEWTFDGRTVRLTTRPAPNPPNFELVRDDPAPVGELLVALEPPGFGENYRLDAIGIDAASGERGLVTSDEKGNVERGRHKNRSCPSTAMSADIFSSARTAAITSCFVSTPTTSGLRRSTSNRFP